MAPHERAALTVIRQFDNQLTSRQLMLVLRLAGVELPKVSNRYSDEDTHFISSMGQKGLFLNNRYNPVDYSSGFGNRHLAVKIFSDTRLLAQVPEALALTSFTLTPLDNHAPSVYRRPPAVALDIINILRAIEAVCPMNLTKSETIRVNTLTQIRKQLGWKKHDLIQDGLPFRDTAAAFIMASLKIGILKKYGGELLVGTPVSEFIALPYAEQIKKLINGLMAVTDWREGRGRQDPLLYGSGNYPSARFMLYYGLMTLPTDTHQFFDLAEFDQALFERVGGSFSFDYIPPRMSFYEQKNYPEKYKTHEADRLKRIRNNWLATETVWMKQAFSSWLYFLGIVELQLTDNDLSGLRLTPLGRDLLHPHLATPQENLDAPTGPVWIIQPNFDIVVYLDRATPQQLVFLEKHTERTQVQQHIAQYRLTRNSVYQGLEQGTALETLIAELKTGADGKLPQNVQVDLQEWGALRDQMTLYESTNLVEFPDETARQTMLNSGMRGTLIGDRFLLMPKMAPSYKKQLTDFGWVNYSHPLPRCLSVNEVGLIKIKQDYGDLLLESQLAKWAEKVDDRRWRLTQATVSSAIKSKARLDDLFSFLNTRLQVRRLPAMLELTLKAWGRKKVRVDMGAITVIRCSDIQVFRAITKSRKLKRYIKGVIGSNLILIHQDKIEALRTELEWSGIIVERGV